MRSPYPTPGIGGAMLRPGVSELYEDCAYLWYAICPRDESPESPPRLGIAPLHEANRRPWAFARKRAWAVWTEDGDDLWPFDTEQRWHFDAEGERPEWLDDDLDGGDLDYHLGALWKDTLSWGLCRGLWPGQPFAVYVPRPEWRVDYYGEADMTCDCEIVRRLPVTTTVRDVERLLADMRAGRRHVQRLRDDARAARWADAASVHLAVDHHEHGVWLRLYSTLARGHFTGWCSLAEVHLRMRQDARGWAFIDTDVHAAISSLVARAREHGETAVARVRALVARGGVPDGRPWTGDAAALRVAR